MRNNSPLVTIAIPNYNYGRYLENCFQSILSQTYDNLEVLFRDNASTDNSMDIVRLYEPIFKKRGIPFYAVQNKRNVGSENNTSRLMADVRGKYYYVLASDDAIESTMIEECVKIFEQFPNVGMVMTNRVEVDENNNETSVMPFYNCKCVIPGDLQASVFMMSGIAIPGERIMRRGAGLSTDKFRRPYQVAGDWFQNYLLSCCNDIGYINKPLCRYRVHSGNETNVSETEMLGIFEHYKLINHFYELAKTFNQNEALKRYDDAVKKLSSMALRYATRYLKHGDKKLAEKYLMLAPVFDPGVISDQMYCKLNELTKMSDNECRAYFAENEVSTVRDKSYDPPIGALILEE